MIFHNNLTTFKISDGFSNNFVNSVAPISFLMKACMLKSVISDWLYKELPNVPDGRSYICPSRINERIKRL